VLSQSVTDQSARPMQVAIIPHDLPCKKGFNAKPTAMRVVASEWHGFQYPPGFGRRVCRVRGKGTTSQTLTKPVPLRRVGGYSSHFHTSGPPPLSYLDNIKYIVWILRKVLEARGCRAGNPGYGVR
jgi:hypothetical protein